MRPSNWRLPIMLLPLLIVTLALASGPTLPVVSESRSYSYGLYARSTANSTGTLQVLWGDPYTAARINQGTGDESFVVTGYVTLRNGLPGYYTYSYPTTTGELEAQWTAGSDSYAVDVYFDQGYSPYNRTVIVPEANTFAAFYVYFKGTLTVNGVTSQVKGLAALVAAASGYFSFQGTARATYIELYPTTYHGNQYIFRWSQAPQRINGIDQPASKTLVQAVNLA